MKRLDLFAIGILSIVMLSAFSQPKSAPGDGLWLRLIGDANQGNDIAVHTYSATVWCWQQGDCTKAEVIDAFDFQGIDSTEAKQFKDSFDGLTTNASARQAMDIHWYLIMAEDGLLSRTQFNTLVGTSMQ